MKLKIDDIIKEVKQDGWELISPNYSNLKEELEFKCPNEHTVFTSLERWRRKHKCPICANNPLANIDSKVVKRKGYRILAFDQATQTSGWSVFDDRTLVKYGTWTSSGNEHIQKVESTKQWVASMIENWKPDMVVFEDIQQQDNVLIYKKLAALQGVLINYVYELGISFKVVPAATWRSHSEIKGKTRTDKKRNAQIKVQKEYDVKVTNDEADAVLLGAYGAFYHSQNEMVSFI